MFVIFDVETVFLYPWASQFGVLSAQFGVFALLEVAVFGAILGIGWGYAWRKRALEWI
jgi:NADH-quinone oxidoreductase subunit A